MRLSLNVSDRTDEPPLKRLLMNQLQPSQLTRSDDDYVRAIFETIPTFVSYLDPSCRYRAVSKHYESLFLRPRSEIIGREMREIVGEATWRQVAPAMARA